LEFKEVASSTREYLKKELCFSINEFNTPDEKGGIRGLALLIQNLVLLEPGTYPDSPDMGVHIGKYQFEYLDNSTLSKIEYEIRQQIEIYIPNHDINYIYVDTFYNESKTIKNILGLAFALNNNGHFFLILKQDRHYNMISQTIL